MVRAGASLIALLLIVLGCGFYLYLRSALPQTDGRIELAVTSDHQLSWQACGLSARTILWKMTHDLA